MQNIESYQVKNKASHKAAPCEARNATPTSFPPVITGTSCRMVFTGTSCRMVFVLGLRSVQIIFVVEGPYWGYLYGFPRRKGRLSWSRRKLRNVQILCVVDLRCRGCLNGFPRRKGHFIRLLLLFPNTRFATSRNARFSKSFRCLSIFQYHWRSGRKR